MEMCCLDTALVTVRSIIGGLTGISRASFLLSEKLKDYGFESEMYDYKIVQVGNDVCRQLGFESKTVQVLWMDWETRLGRMDSDECSYIRQAILLPKRMRGMLEPEEWKPIMGSSLIYRKRLTRSQPWRITWAILLATLLVILGGAVIYRSLGPERFGMADLIYVLFVVGPVFMNMVTQAHKRLRLQADLEVARFIGKEAFVSLLRKIDGLRLEDVETAKTRRILQHFSSKPNIDERIANLT